MNKHKISIRPYTLTILPYNTLLSPVYDFTGACVVALTKIRLCCVIHTYSWCWCLVSWMCSLSFSEPELAVSAAGVAFLSVCMCVRMCVTCCSHCTMWTERERLWRYATPLAEWSINLLRPLYYTCWIPAGSVASNIHTYIQTAQRNEFMSLWTIEHSECSMLSSFIKSC